MMIKLLKHKKKWEEDHEVIRRQLEDLHQQLEDKAAKEGFLHAVGGLLDGYAEDGGADIDFDKDEEEAKDPNNTDKNDPNAVQPVQSASGGAGDNDTQQSVKFTHKHVHKHDHKHICHHKHIHYHDHTGKPTQVYVKTNTIAHTIVHTSTQLKIQRKLFGV